MQPLPEALRLSGLGRLEGAWQIQGTKLANYSSARRNDALDTMNPRAHSALELLQDNSKRRVPMQRMPLRAAIASDAA